MQFTVIQDIHMYHTSNTCFVCQSYSTIGVIQHSSNNTSTFVPMSEKKSFGSDDTVKTICSNMFNNVLFHKINILQKFTCKNNLLVIFLKK